MIKKILVLSLLMVSVAMSGCGGEEKNMDDTKSLGWCFFKPSEC